MPHFFEWQKGTIVEKHLAGKNAIVTGAGRGIGQAIALALAEQGVNIMIVDPGAAREGGSEDTRPASETAEMIRKLGVKAIAAYDSVADFKAAEAMVKRVVSEWGSLDILVNSAGVLREKMVFNMTEEDWDLVIAVHLKGTFNMSRHACAAMREQKSGRIINLTSDAWRVSVGQCNYAAAKGGIVSFTYDVAREMGRYGVTVNAIAPRASTRMTMTDKVREGFRKRYESGVITKEQLDDMLNMPGPEGVSPIILWLCTEQAANANGKVFHAEGGRISVYNEPEEVKSIYKRADNGIFSMDELLQVMPKTIAATLVNPAPAQKG